MWVGRKEPSRAVHSMPASLAGLAVYVLDGKTLKRLLPARRIKRS